MGFWGLLTGSDDNKDDKRREREAAAKDAAIAEEKARKAREQALVIALIKQQEAAKEAAKKAENERIAKSVKEQQDKARNFQVQSQNKAFSQLQSQGEEQAKGMLSSSYPQQTQMQQNVASPSNVSFSQSLNKTTSAQGFTSPQIGGQIPQQTMETAPLVNQKSGGTQRPLNTYNSPKISGLAFGGS